MKNLPQVINKALKLLRQSPEGAALTVSLAGGGSDFYTAKIEPYMVGLIAATGKLRPAETRPLIDLRLYVEEAEGGKGNGYRAYVERITGIGALASIPDPSEFVVAVTADSIDELEVALVAALEDNVKVEELTLATLNYRKNNFSKATFKVKEMKRSRFNFWTATPEDIDLFLFVGDTVGDALRFDGGYEGKSISLWFTLGECLKTLYVTIDMKSQSGKFRVSAEDRACWPWKDKAIEKVVSTKADACEVVANYIAANYSFRIPEASVYFNWS